MIEFDNLDINNVYNVDIDYNKTNLIKNIFEEIDYLVNIFNVDIKKSIIKLFIYNKKYSNTLIDPYINLVNILSKLNFIDQHEYLNIIINIIKILINAKKIEIIITEFNNNFDENKEHINIQKINKLLYKFVNNFIDKNLLIKHIILFIKNIEDEEIIINISLLLAKEYYMYYSANEMFNLFNFLFKNYKAVFIKNYNLIIDNLNNLYEDNNLITQKFKYNFKNNNILNITKSLIKLNNLILN
jgi:hypothetical protein